MARRIAGRDRLSRRWRALPAQIQQSVKPAMAGGADVMVQQMQALAPENRWPEQGKPWQVPGTLKRAINWIWTGASRITIAARPHEMINLGLWTEKGTEGRAAGESYRALHRRRTKTGLLQNFFWARKARRGHPATRAQPFFVIVWRAARGRLFSFVRDAAKKGLQ